MDQVQPFLELEPPPMSDEASVYQERLQSHASSAFSTPSRSTLTDFLESPPESKLLERTLLQDLKFSPISPEEELPTSPHSSSGVACLGGSDGVGNGVSTTFAAQTKSSASPVPPHGGKPPLPLMPKNYNDSTGESPDRSQPAIKIRVRNAQITVGKSGTESTTGDSTWKEDPPGAVSPPEASSPATVTDETPRVSNQKALLTTPPPLEISMIAMATEVNKAFHKLKDFAASAVTDPTPPDVVDTSVESADIEFDRVALVEEIRNEGKAALFKTNNMGSSGGMESSLKPATPSRGAETKEIRSVPLTATAATANAESLMTTDHTTPIMRMRDPSVQDALTEKETGVAIPSSPPMQEADFQQAKQRKWKRKLKQAERRKAEERQKLDGGRRNKKIENRANRRDASPSVPCGQDGLFDVVHDFVSSRCGGVADALSSFEKIAVDYSSDSSDASEEDDLSECESDSMPSKIPIEREPKEPPHRGTSTKMPPPRDRVVVDEKKTTVNFRNPPVNHPRMCNAAEPVQPSFQNTAASLAKKCVDASAPIETVQNKNFIRNFIDLAKDKGIEVMFHSGGRMQEFSKPVKGKVFLKDGQSIANGRFVGPRLIWDLDSSDHKAVVDLFDIRSLDKAIALQLQSYPFAVPGRSVLLRINQGHDYVFELKDEVSALHFVHGMRWLVARLAFNLIIGNVNVSCELLQLGDCSIATKASLSRGAVLESRLPSAMNNLSNHLVDKTLLFTS